jgi:hypothetical protein
MPNLVGIKKKMVPSDLISQPNSPPACTALSFAIRIAGCCPFGSAPPSFESNASMPPGSPASFPGRNRYLEAAFHSPKTTVRLRTAILRSKFPTYFFNTLPNIRRARSVPDSFARSGSPRHAQDPYQKPVADSRPAVPTVPRISTPLWGLSDPSGSKRSTRFPAVKLTFRTRPIACHSPAPALFY